MKRICMIAVAALVFLTSTMLWAGGSQEEPGALLRVAALFPGSIQDADYNTLGYRALQELGNNYDVEIAYSEKVAVPDAERVLKEYVNAGYDVIWVHGAQFNSAAIKVGMANPDTIFVIEIDQRPDEIRDNFFYIQRNYYIGFYVLGRAAAMKTETGMVGYVGGLELPFTRGQINAINQAFEDSKGDGKLEYVFDGDFNDAVKAREAAEELIGKGADVLISAVNLGNFGLYKAVKQAEREVYLTTTYTSKKEQAPDHYLTSDLFDFTVPIADIVGRILYGETSGFVPMRYGPGKARYTEFPVNNVSEEQNRMLREIALKVASGELEVKMNLQEIEE